MRRNRSYRVNPGDQQFLPIGGGKKRDFHRNRRFSAVRSSKQGSAGVGLAAQEYSGVDDGAAAGKDENFAPA
jgi:hypothetical protein